jgi:hypothetical protein
MRPTTALSLTLLFATTFAATSAFAAEERPARATTVAAAAKVLDLSTLPRVDGSNKPGQQSLARLSYESKGTVAEAFDFHKAALVERGFKEMPASYLSEQSSSAAFQNNGYTVSLGVFQTGSDDKVSITLNQHGNVDLAKLPMPADVKPLYAGPVSVMAVSKAAPDAARNACRKLLVEQGWEPYGEAGDALFFRQNAVQLTANVLTAPAQDNQTTISYSTALMSSELPASPKAMGVHYSDSPTQLEFDFPGRIKELTVFYARALEPAGWKQTTAEPFDIEIYKELIYRNPAKDLLRLRMHEIPGKTRGLLRFQSAAEVAEEERLANAELDRGAKENGTPMPSTSISINLPAGAKNVKATKNEIEFSVANRKAKAAVEQLVKDLKSKGWKGDAASLEDVAGAVSLSSGDANITIHYTDTGFLPAEIGIDAIGIELERAKRK